MKQKSGSGWKGESRRHSLARKGVKTVLPDGRRFDVSNFVAEGRVIHGYDIDKIYNGFITAMLWVTPNDYDNPDFYLESEYSIYDIDKETEQKIKHLIEDFMYENYELFDQIQIEKDIFIDEEKIGHDLFLTSQGHGVGFWDRGYGHVGDLLTKETGKFFNEGLDVFAGEDGKIYVDGMLYASGEPKEIRYNGHLITKLFPSGYYEYYSDKEGRFIKSDELDIIKARIRDESLKANALSRRYVFDEEKEHLGFTRDEIMDNAWHMARDRIRSRNGDLDKETSSEMKKVLKENGYDHYVGLV